MVQPSRKYVFTENGGILQRNYDLKHQWGKHNGLPGG